jgi:hypothetical protein
MATTRRRGVRRTTRQRSSSFGGGVPTLIGALAESYIDLVAGTARVAGNVVGDLADECSQRTVLRPGRRRYDDYPERRRGGARAYDDDDYSDEYDDEGPDYTTRDEGEREAGTCGCLVTPESVADDCVDVLDHAVHRLYDSWEERGARHAEGEATTARAGRAAPPPRPAARATTTTTKKATKSTGASPAT